MEGMVRCLPILALLALAGIARLDGAGECGRVSEDRTAFQLAPCASASHDGNAAVSSPCCSAVQKICQNPTCVCAVMLSDTAKSSGVKPEVAMIIPKRCNIADRPICYKCGRLLL